MRGKSLITPRSQIYSSLRTLWLRSRERASAIKRDKYTCVSCGRKQSKAKGKEFSVQVHHKNGISNWEKIVELIREEMLCSADELETLCKECHEKIGHFTPLEAHSKKKKPSFIINSE
jgi:5-methylcytosine-specific restriction endonuclease McrA